MKTVKAASVLLVILLIAAAAAPCAVCSGAPVAEAVSLSGLAEGERFYIVNDAGKNTVSKYSAGKRLAPAAVSVGTLDGKGVLYSVSDDAAVFVYEKTADGYILLRSERGYLTSAEAGNGLYYAEEPGEYSLWSFVDGCYILNVNAAYTSNGTVYKNNYLEYYPRSDYYSTYGKSQSSDASLYKMSFYRVCGEVNEQASGGGYRLPVFETSDLHGYLVDTSGDKYEYRLAYIFDKVRDARGRGEEYRKDRALLLDGGDIYQGNTVSNLLEGVSMSAAFDLMDYDAVTIGNHEFDWFIENTVDSDGTMKDYAINGVKHENDVPVVMSDMYYNGEKIPFSSDKIIIEKTAVDGDGNEMTVRICVIGFAPDYSSSIMNAKFTGAGYSIDADCGAVNVLAKELEDSGACDATVLLVHGDAAETAAELGRQSAVDLVLGGHTHQSLCGKTSWGLQYVQPEGYGKAYAYAELVFEAGDDGKPILSGVSAAQTGSAQTGQLYKEERNKNELDGELVDLSDVFIDAISGVLDEQIGYITVSASRYDYIAGSGERATTAGNWLASVTARAADADVGFINAGGIRTDFTVEPGSDRRVITASDIYTMFPFENRIYCYELTYADFFKLLEYSLTDSGSTLLSRMYGIDCYYTGRTVNAIVKDGEAVYLDGKWMNGAENKKIKVALSEFIATSDRPDGGMSNPLCEWNGTDRLISSLLVDCDGAFEVLKGEAEKSGGELYVDAAPHYIAGTYSPQDRSMPDDPLTDGGAGTEPYDEADGKAVKTVITVAFIVTAAVIFAVAAICAVTLVVYIHHLKKGRDSQ